MGDKPRRTRTHDGPCRRCLSRPRVRDRKSMVNSDLPSQGLQVGDQVRVPWGLDTVDGVVEEVYEAGAGPRVVIRILDPESGEKTETVALPAEAVAGAAEGEPRSPGAWLTEARYRNSLAEALQRLLPTLSEEGNLRAQAWAEPRIHPDRRPDFLVRAGPRTVVIEAKAGRGKNLTAEAVHQLRAFLASLPRYVSGLLVTDAKLTSQAQALLRENPQLDAVQWRSARDDHRLADALGPLLHGNIGQEQED